MIEPKMLAYLDTKDRDAVDDWARQHYEWHSAIYNEARRQGFPNFETYPILRDILGDFESWGYFHDLEHRNIAVSLRYGGNIDLSEVDFNDEVSRDSWLEVHSEIHVDLRSALGIR